MPYKPSRPESADRLREAAKARGRAIRRRHRVWRVAASAFVAVIVLGGGLAAALAGPHPATRVYVSGQPSRGGSGGTAHGTTAKPPGSTGSGLSVPPSAGTARPPKVCTSGQVSLRAQADKSAYAWGDPISLTVRLSLVGPTPCVVERSEFPTWYLHSCFPEFSMADSQPTVPGDTVGPWAQGCTETMMRPFVLTAHRPDVVELTGAITCLNFGKPCPTPKPGTRPWTVRVQWSWTTSPTALHIAGRAQFDFNVAVTSPHPATTTTRTATTTTTALAR